MLEFNLLTKTFEPKYYQKCSPIRQIQLTLPWLLKHLKKRSDKFWCCAEFTTQGIIHYHIIYEPKSLADRNWLINALQRQGKPDNQILKNFDNCYKYIIKEIFERKREYKEFYSDMITEGYLKSPKSSDFIFTNLDTVKSVRSMYPTLKVKMQMIEDHFNPQDETTLRHEIRMQDDNYTATFLNNFHFMKYQMEHYDKYGYYTI